MPAALRPALRVVRDRGVSDGTVHPDDGAASGGELGDHAPQDADREFLDALHEHLDRLHNLARGLTGSRQDAEDLLQETCLLALRGWRRGRPDDPGAWLATICLNASRSAHRRRSARPQEVPADAWLLDRADDLADTAGQAMGLLEAGRLRAALELLPVVQREAITLMDLGGYTAAQVALATGAPRGTVLARVHRGRKALAGLLSGQEVQRGARP